MNNLSDSFPASSGNILEVIQGSADGRSITVGSGTYTLQNVTAYQTGSTSYADVTGSSISYTPPTNTKYILYRFDMQFGSQNSTAISHWYIDVDGTIITKSKKTLSGNYSGSHGHVHQGYHQVFYWVFDLTADSDNAAQGKFSSWNSAKTIKVRYRNYSSTYMAAPHRNTYRDGDAASGSFTFHIPTLTVIAYG
jgi:hypothetical protein